MQGFLITFSFSASLAPTCTLMSDRRLNCWLVADLAFGAWQVLIPAKIASGSWTKKKVVPGAVR